MIVMTWCGREGRWVPCDPELRMYRRSGGPFTFVDTEGNLCRGERVSARFFDPAAEPGYRKHRIDCASAGRNAV